MPPIEVKKAKLSDEGKKELRYVVYAWGLASLVYVWLVWLLFVFWVYPMDTDFTKSYTTITAGSLAIWTIVCIAYA